MILKRAVALLTPLIVGEHGRVHRGGGVACQQNVCTLLGHSGEVPPASLVVEWLLAHSCGGEVGPNKGLRHHDDEELLSATRKFTKLFTLFRSDGVFKKDLWLVGSRATVGIENDPRIRQLDVAGIVWLDHFPAKNSDIEVLRFVLVAHGEEESCEEAFVCNRRVG